jgi:hypothetical protein
MLTIAPAELGALAVQLAKVDATEQWGQEQRGQIYLSSKNKQTNLSLSTSEAC